MYKRNEKSQNKGGRIVRKIWALLTVSMVVLGICVLFTLMAMKVMAAPENPEVEAFMVQAQTAAAGESTSQAVPPEIIISKEEEAAPLIVIDPGHGGEDNGCQGGEILEKDINLQIARLVEEKLLEKGYRVALTREDDTYIAKEDRVKWANELSADLYICIHQNSYEGTDAVGIETWYDGSKGEESKRLAQLIHYETISAAKAQARELIDSTELHVPSNTQMPSCLIETGFLSNQEERKLLSDEAYQEKLAEGIVQGIDLYFYPKTMYLTFDDGPSPENTEKILDVLKEKDIKATFFMVGEYVERYPEIAKRVAEEGHVIGIHCYNHDYEVLYESVDSYLADFEKAYEVIKGITGVEPVFFRFPGGSVNAYNQEICKEIAEEMTARGFIYYDWNASLEDAVRKAEPEELIAYARETTLGRKKVVMLAHDTVTNTALCLSDLIDQFPEYQMEVLKPGLKPIQFPQPEE